MSNHWNEKNSIKPRIRTVEPSDKSPGNGKVGVTSVMNFASNSVYCVSVKGNQKEEIPHTPSISKKLFPSFSLDDLRVFQLLPWQLRESLTRSVSSLSLTSEAVFLRVTSIPDPVHKQVTHK